MEVESPLKICISIFPWNREVTNGIVAASVIPAKAAEVRVWRVSDQLGYLMNAGASLAMQ